MLLVLITFAVLNYLLIGYLTPCHKTHAYSNTCTATHFDILDTYNVSCLVSVNLCFLCNLRLEHNPIMLDKIGHKSTGGRFC